MQYIKEYFTPMLLRVKSLITKVFRPNILSLIYFIILTLQLQEHSWVLFLFSHFLSIFFMLCHSLCFLALLMDSLSLFLKVFFFYLKRCYSDKSIVTVGFPPTTKNLINIIGDETMNGQLVKNVKSGFFCCTSEYRSNMDAYDTNDLL